MSIKAKRKYECAVNGVVATIGKLSAMCGYVKCNNDCGAHGNRKCKHKKLKSTDKGG